MRFVGLIVMVLVLAACGGERVAPMSQEDMDGFVGASIPASAQNISIQGLDRQTTMVALTFTASQTDVDAYLNTIGIGGAPEPGVSPFQATTPPPFDDLAGWTIPDLSDPELSYRGANSVRLDAKFYNVLVVDGDGDSATLFMQVFELS